MVAQQTLSVLQFNFTYFKAKWEIVQQSWKYGSIETYHIWPDGACKLTWDEYWKAGWSFERMGSWAITPLPLTVSNVPESEKILQFLSRNWTDNSPRFSNRMQYRHCKKIEKRVIKLLILLSFYALVLTNHWMQAIDDIRLSKKLVKSFSQIRVAVTQCGNCGNYCHTFLTKISWKQRFY